MPSTEGFRKGITIHTPHDANTPYNYLMVEVKSVKYALSRGRQAQISKKKESKAKQSTAHDSTPR